MVVFALVKTSREKRRKKEASCSPCSNMTDIKALEYSTLKVPYEILNKKFRTAQKVIDREVSYVVTATNELTSALGKQPVKANEIAGMLDGVVQKIQALKRKSEECLNQEEACVKHCKTRLDHIKEHSDERKSSVLVWKKKRLDRMLVDHCLRQGFYETAKKLATEADIEVHDLVDIDLFVTSRQVEEALHKGESGPCLSWCYENKSKLRKLKSTLEFNVRMQEFIELIRRDERIEAIKYARKHFANADQSMTKEIQRAMALLAFKPQMACSPYKELFDPCRWNRLVEQFRKENFQLHQLNDQSVLSVTLQAGLSALKTPHCYQEGHKMAECPVCSHPLNILGDPLPFAHCAQSRLVCPISGQIMNENNPPMVLPNGFVYGEKALHVMSREKQGKITCPRTKDDFHLDQAMKVYVM